MRPGDHVQWTNQSYFQDTQGEGEVIHVCGDHVLVFNPKSARSHPHISPYVAKRVWELRLIEQQAAAA